MHLSQLSWGKMRSEIVSLYYYRLMIKTIFFLLMCLEEQAKNQAPSSFLWEHTSFIAFVLVSLGPSCLAPPCRCSCFH